MALGLFDAIDVRDCGARRCHQLVARADPLERAQAVGLGGVDGLAGEEHLANLLDREHAHQVRGRAEGAPVDLGQTRSWRRRTPR